MQFDFSQPSFLDWPLFQKRWVRHLIFWVGYVTFFTLVGEGELSDLRDALRAELILLPVKMLAVYVTLYGLLPLFLLRNRYALFVSFLTILLIGAAFLQRAVIYYVLYPITYPDMPYGDFVNSTQIIRYGLTILGVLLLATAIKIVKYWYKDQQTAKAMIKAKLEAELKFLKSQIHPHFLFNTLNNLYSLTLKKSDSAPEMVLRLSGLVNYMLYEASAPSVPLSKEIENMHNYIALERLRYGESLDIFFDVSGNVNGTRIAPLMLLPFIENSFKHGVSDELSDKWISINLNVNHAHMTFKVENSRSRDVSDAPPADYKGGIGLKNVKRRLELLYPDSHQLTIRDEADTYLIILKLSLDNLLERNPIQTETLLESTPES